MQTIYKTFFTAIIIAWVFNCISATGENQWKLTLRGRAVSLENPSISIPADAKLEVYLQDISLADAPARIIAQYTGKAFQFPMAFALKYVTSDINPFAMHSLQVLIRNPDGELLYINDVHIPVRPIGSNRSTFVDVPVKSVKQPKIETPSFEFVTREWPELVGKSGEQAVRVIREQTGFTNVHTVPEGSPITMDYRSDRVRVFVNRKGLVVATPSIA